MVYVILDRIKMVSTAAIRRVTPIVRVRGMHLPINRRNLLLCTVRTYIKRLLTHTRRAIINIILLIK